MNIRNTVSIAALATFALFSAGVAQGNTISGRLWHVPEANTNAIPANVPATTPYVTFDVTAPGINFNATEATVGAWLASGSAFNIVQNIAGTLASRMDDGTGTTGTIVEFTGLVTVTTGQMFTVTHDDGLKLIIGGIDLGFDPGPTPPIMSTATYTGPSGTFAFRLIYGECCGGPAVLQISLPFVNAVPEPATLALLGLGLAGMGFARRRRMH